MITVKEIKLGRMKKKNPIITFPTAYAESVYNFLRRLAAGEMLFKCFRAFFPELPLALAFLPVGGVSLIGPGGTPFFSALPLGVADGGTLKLCGGKGV